MEAKIQSLGEGDAGCPFPKPAYARSIEGPFPHNLSHFAVGNSKMISIRLYHSLDRDTNLGHAMLKRSKAANVVLTAGAAILASLAIFFIYFAVAIDHSGRPTKSASRIRHNCAAITDAEFHADCLAQAKRLAHGTAKSPEIP